jgi:exopolysaccharide biosynthesis polyprenyl glycosylphosphotransferase
MSQQAAAAKVLALINEEAEAPKNLLKLGWGDMLRKNRLMGRTKTPMTDLAPSHHIVHFLDKRLATRVLPPAINLESPFSVAYLVSPMDHRFQWAAKRMFDLSATILGLVVILPLLAFITLAIRLDSPGPVLFKQQRVGLHGKMFQVYKFRSMHPDAEARLQELLENNQTNGGMFKMVDDPRLTRVGKFLRKYSLDEFPQLLNVLKGHMSLVGPRPPIARELNVYDRWHHVRFATLPGMTGAWQVNGRSSITNFDQVVALDFDYIAHWSLWSDIKILLKTFPVVLFGKGA